MFGWYHHFNGHGFGGTPGVGDGQGGLACCGSWGHKDSDMTERVKLTERNHSYTNIGITYDPAISLLGIHTKETRIERDTCIPMFIAALFIIARTWKQPRRPSADKWIRDLWYIDKWNITQPLKRRHLNQF